MFLGQNQIMTPVASPLMCLHKYNPHFKAQIKGTIQSKQLQISLFSLYLLRNGLLLFLVSWQIVENCMCFFDQGQQIQSINSNISFSALKYIFGNITNSISGILVGFFFCALNGLFCRTNNDHPAFSTLELSSFVYTKWWQAF